MLKTILSISIASLVMSQAITSCTSTTGADKKTTGQPDSTSMVLRGEYLVRSVGCDDCHSPKRMGPNGPEIIPELRFSGFPQDGQLPPTDTSAVKKGWVLMAPDMTAAVGPWGMSFASNITSDASGIGNWKEENFMQAIRHGKYKGLETGRNLLPPMPWVVYRNMTDEDIKSIFAYLKTTAPVNNVAPAPIPFDKIK